jgi:hypothetical protein
VILVAVLAVASLPAFAGCGGGDGDEGSSAGATTGLPPGHAGVIVISGWVNALRHGDVDRAAGYFALPSVVENGTPPVTLRSRAQAVAFNRSLPCGAKLVRARPVGGVIAATFRLTERPGGACGPGVGLLARTAFVSRDGKIAQWRRLPTVGSGQRQPSGPVV